MKEVYLVMFRPEGLDAYYVEIVFSTRVFADDYVKNEYATHPKIQGFYKVECWRVFI